jgi:Terminase large subunit, T4likevirus-type, N-terminal
MSVSILKALDDPRLFAGVLRNKATWAPWRAFLGALFGLPMSEAEADIYRACTGRNELPTGAFNEAWLVCGRRAGKSFVLALIAVYLAAFKSYRDYLGPGERATVMIVAADRKQAKIVIRFVKGLLAVPALAKLIEAETADSVDLTNQMTIEVGTASYKSIRGYSIAAALCDEIAFFPQEDSATPDVEILAALRPAMATIPGAMLLCSSPPYARRGVLWESYKRYYGSADPNVLVWQAATRVMNATVSQRFIDEETERDPARASAEYNALFRTDVDSFVSREVVEACVDDGVFERAPLSSVRYFGFVDPSGGSADSFTAAVAHQDRDQVILDAVREQRPPFSPEVVAKQFAEFFLSYHVSSIRGDHYAGEWPKEQFRKHGVDYLPADKTRSELYLEMLPKLNSRRVALLDDKRLVQQLVGLERKTSRAGKDSIDHAPGGHDDVANAVAGAIVYAAARAVEIPIVAPILIGLDSPRYYPHSDRYTGGGDEARAYADRRSSGFTITGGKW